MLALIGQKPIVYCASKHRVSDTQQYIQALRAGVLNCFEVPVGGCDKFKDL